jgi:hypothetical protein
VHFSESSPVVIGGPDDGEADGALRRRSRLGTAAHSGEGDGVCFDSAREASGAASEAGASSRSVGTLHTNDADRCGRGTGAVAVPPGGGDSDTHAALGASMAAGTQLPRRAPGDDDGGDPSAADPARGERLEHTPALGPAASMARNRGAAAAASHVLQYADAGASPSSPESVASPASPPSTGAAAHATPDRCHPATPATAAATQTAAPPERTGAVRRGAAAVMPPPLAVASSSSSSSSASGSGSSSASSSSSASTSASGASSAASGGGGRDRSRPRATSGSEVLSPAALDRLDPGASKLGEIGGFAGASGACLRCRGSVYGESSAAVLLSARALASGSEGAGGRCRER